MLNTSIRFSPKHANISTLHRPSPRTATSRSSTSASLARTSIPADSSPLANLPASPDTYSALRPDRPAVRSSARSAAATVAGGGKKVGEAVGLGKRAMNLRLMDLAAAPETCFCLFVLDELFFLITVLSSFVFPFRCDGRREEGPARLR